jgi:ribonuclease G
MNNLLLINADGPARRVALVENGQAAELHVERPNERGIVGNVYKGRVVRVLPGMQAAFVDIGVGRAAFLYVADVGGLQEGVSSLYFADSEEQADEDDLPREEFTTAAPGNIQDRIKEGQEILVQVAKEPIGTKGARITSYISLPGRHLVFMPTVDHVGISRRIVGEAERQRLREIVDAIRPPGMGFIVRTVAEGQSEEMLRADMEFLLKLWEEILRRNSSEAAPALLYEDLDLSLRTVRDLFSSNVERLIVDDLEEYERLLEFISNFAPRYQSLVELYSGDEPLFEYYGIEMELDRALERKVWLKSGGYLVMDQGEALTSVDVNTGRYVGRRSLEDTITKTNLEAVREVVNQLRLRNIGGIIIIDFIDMEQESNRGKVWRALVDALQADRAKCNVLKISDLGLVEMTRKRVRESLEQQLTETCPYCEGKGHIKSPFTVCHDVLREIRRQAASLPGDRIVVAVHPEVADQMASAQNDYIALLEQRYDKDIVVKTRANFHVEQFEIHVNVTGSDPGEGERDNPGEKTRQDR